ncbi:MAG: BtrH N-terminal domain-containing protein [Proteobacteria bacterium]|nr:BtrH N-terminal domain-containing protein [Pseudomonadota bacterium]
MKTLIDGYRNFPGEHCGSVAMRGLLNHYCQLELPEEVVFGLGAGLGCMFVSMPGADPEAVVFGRTATMEVDLAASLGVDYREEPDPDDTNAWEAVRQEVLAGRPTMLTGDIFYLDYREFKVHFPGHRFVLVGFDDDKQEAYIADRIREEPEACSYQAVAKSRNPPDGMSTQNLWGRFGDGAVQNDLIAACRHAIGLCARRMLGEEKSGDFDGASSAVSGVDGIRALAAAIPTWRESDDASSLARYNASCIEKFGNGGGNFRRLYAGFLTWARERDATRVPADAASLAWQAADAWTGLSQRLAAAAEGEDVWQQAARTATDIVRLEQRLFEKLARSQEGGP